MKKEWIYWGLGIGVALLLLNRATGGGLFRETAAGVTGGILDIPAGVVLGIGDALGIPRTDADNCAAALAAGNDWEAAKYCPVAKTVGGWFDGEFF